MSRSAVATLVERKSRLLRLIHLPGGHRSDHLVAALTVALAGVDSGKLLTLTWDQGSEMAGHREVARLFSEGVFFADPGCPWMRGTNENNGLLRQYFPTKTDLSLHSAEHVLAVVDELNQRPRQTLGSQTPNEVFKTAGVALIA